MACNLAVYWRHYHPKSSSHRWQHAVASEVLL
jgi:hypothetical protein